MNAEAATIYGAAIGVGGTVLGAVVGGAFAWWAANRTNAVQQVIATGNMKLQQELAAENARSQQRAYLDALVLKMIEIIIEHPHLEKDSFCQSYPNIINPDAKERYEAYCCFVFNTLMAAFSHFGQDGQKLTEYLHVDEIIKKHHIWWLLDIENQAYDRPFRQYIQIVIDRLKKAREIV